MIVILIVFVFVCVTIYYMISQNIIWYHKNMIWQDFNEIYKYIRSNREFLQNLNSIQSI